MVPKTLRRPLSVISATARFPTMSSGGVEFQLSASSVLKILKGDLTRWSVDGSSDAIPAWLKKHWAFERAGIFIGQSGGGADGAIDRAAGPELRAACYNVPEVRRGVRCPTGEARITRGFQLPASHVIHTVGPMYETDENPQVSLKKMHIETVYVLLKRTTFNLLHSPLFHVVYGYPYEEAATVAISTVKELENDFKEVHFGLFSNEIFDVWSNKANELLQN